MAVAGLVLGIIGVLVAIVPFVFWVGTLAGLTGLGLGIAGLVRARRGAPRKGLALTGAVLGLLSLAVSVGGFFLTVKIVDEVDRYDDSISDEYEWPEPDQYDDQYGDEYEDEGSGGYDGDPDAPAGPGVTTPLAFGATYSYPTDISVSVAQPRPYTTANEYIEVKNAVQVSFTLTNGTDRVQSFSSVLPTVTDDQGRPCRPVFDGRMPKRISGTVQPGRSVTGTAAFELPPGTERIRVRISPKPLQYQVRFAGPVG
ncbi:DUF4352 domain-containing protein [Streptomyces sp. RerS4]|nr:DUF4352 domain-containing protein [Streptomyces sp. RerS4]